MKPGFLSWLYRMFIDARVEHWCARYRDQLMGVITWQPTSNYADHLWLAVKPDNEDIATYTLLNHIVGKFKHKRPCRWIILPGAPPTPFNLPVFSSTKPWCG
jgi:hypothetical protein